MIPFLAPFMEARGIGGATQGSLLAFRTALAIVAQPLIGLMADRFGIGRALRGAALVTAAHSPRRCWRTRLSPSRESSCCWRWGLLPRARCSTRGAISELESSGHEPARFSHVRLWGSAGFALAALGFGVAFSGAAKASVAPAAVIGMAVLSAAALAVSLFVPARPRVAPLTPPALADIARIVRIPGVPAILRRRRCSG